MTPEQTPALPPANKRQHLTRTGPLLEGIGPGFFLPFLAGILNPMDMEAVLFFNGWGATLASVQPWLTSLKPRPVVAQDLRGAGLQAKNLASFSIHDLARDGLSWLHAMGLEKAHVMGVSMGGLVAQAFALNHAEACVSLSLLSTYPGSRVRIPIAEQDRAVWQDDTENPKNDARRRLRLVLSEDYQAKRPDAVKRLSNTMLLGLSDDQVKGRQAQQQAMTGFDPWDQLPQVSCPVLLMTGDGDRVVPYGNSLLLKEKLPQARLEILSGAGHLLLVEKPRETARNLQVFWRSLDQQTKG